MCSQFSELEIRQIDRWLDQEPIRTVANRIGVHQASVRRHGLNHRHRGIVRTVLLTDDLDAYDLIDSLAASYLDADKVRAESLRRGTTAGYTLALRAMRTQQQVAAQLFTSLGIDAQTYATRNRDQEHLYEALIRLLRKRPSLALDVADEVQDDDELAAELRRIASTAPQKETAVA